MPSIPIGGNCSNDGDCINNLVGASLCWGGVCSAITLYVSFFFFSLFPFCIFPMVWFEKKKANFGKICVANKINLASPHLVLLLAFAQLGKKIARSDR
jgi:hypothetical protein